MPEEKIDSVKDINKNVDMPAALKNEEKVIKTVSRSLKDLIKEKLDQLSDLATLELMLPVDNRMRHRLESIKKMGSARTIKVRGHHKTTAPKMHISNLQGAKVGNDVAEITFGVYDVDEKNNKKEHKNYSEEEVIGKDGEPYIKKKHSSSQYNIAYEVTETIRSGKPITRETIRVDRVEN